MGRFVVGMFAGVMLLASVPAGHAAEITVESPSSSTLGREPPTLRLTGALRQGDAAAMRRLLVRLKAERTGLGTGLGTGPLATVELSSLGGDLNEGLELGYLFRDFNVATVVRRRDICLSACALAFLGGTASRDGKARTAAHAIEVGARLGFHTFYLNTQSADAPTADDPERSRRQGFREAQAATAALVRYAADLGIDPKFVATMMARPPEELTYVATTEDFLTLDVCPIGLARPAISLAEQALNVCNHATGWQDPAEIDQVRLLPPQQARRTMLENIQQNMQTLKVKGALSDQLASWSVMRVERSIDNLYDDLRAAGVRLPEIVGPVFEVRGYRQGGREMQCFVSLSVDAADRYDVAIRRPGKWSHPDRSAPRDCRGLFLHDRDATINPRPVAAR